MCSLPLFLHLSGRFNWQCSPPSPLPGISIGKSPTLLSSSVCIVGYHHTLHSPSPLLGVAMVVYTLSHQLMSVRPTTVWFVRSPSFLLRYLHFTLYFRITLPIWQSAPLGIPSPPVSGQCTYAVLSQPVCLTSVCHYHLVIGPLPYIVRTVCHTYTVLFHYLSNSLFILSVNLF